MTRYSFPDQRVTHVANELVNLPIEEQGRVVRMALGYGGTLRLMRELARYLIEADFRTVVPHYWRDKMLRPCPTQQMETHHDSF